VARSKGREAQYSLFVNKRNIKEVSLRQLVQWMFFYEVKGAWFSQLGRRKIIFAFVLRDASKILDDGTFIVREFVNDVLFTSDGIEEYKRRIVYDPYGENYYYVNETEYKQKEWPADIAVITISDAIDSTIEEIKKTLAKIITKRQ